MNSIYSRVSIRKYQDKPVEKEKIEAILRAAMQAPSAANQQPWEFYVVTNKEKLEALSKVHPYAGMTKNAPAAIVSVYRKDCALPDYAQIDLAISMENLWLDKERTGGYCFSLSEGLCSPGLRPDRSGHLHGEPLAGNQRAGSWRCMAGDCADGGTYAGCGENLRSSRYGSGLCTVPVWLSCGGEKAAGQV